MLIDLSSRFTVWLAQLVGLRHCYMWNQWTAPTASGALSLCRGCRSPKVEKRLIFGSSGVVEKVRYRPLKGKNHLPASFRAIVRLRVCREISHYRFRAWRVDFSSRFACRAARFTPIIILFGGRPPNDGKRKEKHLSGLGGSAVRLVPRPLPSTAVCGEGEDVGVPRRQSG